MFQKTFYLQFLIVLTKSTNTYVSNSQEVITIIAKYAYKNPRLV